VLRNLSRDYQQASVYIWAQARAKNSKSKIYTCMFTHVMPGPDAARFLAFSTSELPYFLNTLYACPRPFTAADLKLSDQMSSFWANFAKSGDPNGKDLPQWPAVFDRPGTTMEIGDTFQVIPITASPERLSVFQEFYSNPRPPVPPLRWPGQ
jgi:para-nitrobenzyl esterase